MKKTRRTYTREFKLEALRLLDASGESAAQSLAKLWCEVLRFPPGLT
jgi:transposase-like protein